MAKKAKREEQAGDRAERLKQEDDGAYVKIRLLQEVVGLGAAGDVVPVGRERAERWAREGLASLDLKPEKKK